MLKNILVYGWYFQDNIGDDLFVDAFKKIFPQLNLIFTNQFTQEQLQECEAVFIGGGSFLDHPLKMAKDLIPQIKEKLVFYIGVGAETNIHAHHLELLKIAKIVAVRSRTNIKEISSINSNTIIIPDIVYALSDEVKFNLKIPHSILIMPNIFILPKQEDPYWKHAAWDYFKSEFSQFLNSLVEQKYLIKFLPLSYNATMHDNWVATELVNRLNKRHSNYVLEPVHNINNLTSLISSYEVVITQRFHGIVLSEMADTPYLSIHHHDKLKPPFLLSDNFISYYALNKHLLLEKIKNIRDLSFSIPIERNIFKQLNELILNILSG